MLTPTLAFASFSGSITRRTSSFSDCPAAVIANAAIASAHATLFNTNMQCLPAI
jgi:hypothetical protein